jgi:hypothetical protein
MMGKRMNLAEVHPLTKERTDMDKSNYCDALMAGAPGPVT